MTDDIQDRLVITEADGRHLPLHDLRQEAAHEIRRLRTELSKWKARAQVMREAWRQTDWMQWIGYDYPEARDWFDDDGVPRD